MKKVRLYFIAFVIIVAIINYPVTALARTGGGGSSGSGGSGGSGGTHSSSGYHGGSGNMHSSSGYYSESSSRGESNPILGTIFTLAFVFSITGGSIIVRIKIMKKRKESIRAIKLLEKYDCNWDYRKIRKDIEEAFRMNNLAWMKRNQDIAREYSSDKLNENHRMKLEWMEVKNQINIIKRHRLLDIIPVGLENHNGIDKDVLWVLIRGKAIDYIINEETGEIVSGNKYYSIKYEEYWRFIKTSERWVLDEIRQIDDIDNLDYFEIINDDE